MQLCNCNKDEYYNISNIDNYNPNGLTCLNCGYRIHNEDIIMLLMREVKELKQTSIDLKYERDERQRIEESKECERQIKDELAMKETDKQIERFRMLDL